MPIYYSPNNPGALGARVSGGPKKRLRYEGEALTDYGVGLQRDALGDLDSLADRFQGEIDAGGLPQHVADAFEVGRGDVNELRTRASRSFGAELGMRARQSGGKLSPEAQAALALEREAGLDEEEFDAMNRINQAEAFTRLERTDRLYNSIMQIREAKLGTGTTNIGQGLSARGAALDPRKHNGQITQAVLSNLGDIDKMLAAVFGG